MEDLNVSANESIDLWTPTQDSAAYKAVSSYGGGWKHLLDDPTK